jgi:hypothetical protein
MSDRRLIVGEFDSHDANTGKLFALAPGDATGVPIPSFAVGAARPSVGSIKGEGYYDTLQRQGFVWTGSAWQGIAPNPIMTFNTEALLLAETTARPGTYATAGDTGSLFIKVPGGWRQVGIKQYPTAADLFGDAAAATGALGEVMDEDSLWEKTATGWRLMLVREMATTAAITAWTNTSPGATVGDRAVDKATGVLYIRLASGWRPISIWEETEANIRASTWALNGQEAIATDTGRTFARVAGKWVEEPIAHYATEADLLAATPQAGTLAWADDTNNVFARVGAKWIGTNTGFYDPTPIGSISAYPTGVIPSGWLLCDGATIPAGTEYDALRTLLGTTTVPDLRGQFLRGAATTTDTLLAKHQWTTGRPRTTFTGLTNNDGDHHHTVQYAPANSKAGPDYKQMEDWGAGRKDTSTDGAHFHTVMINGGGDAETAPDHVKVNWCIKAKFATLVPANSLRVNTTTTVAEGDILTYDATNGSWRNRQWTSVGATAPATPAKGFTWFDTDKDELKVYNGTAWAYASTPHWEATVTMGANAGTVGNQVLLAKGIVPQNDGIYISITDTQVGHSPGRAAYAIHAFSTDSMGSAKATPIHIETTGTRFSKLHWFWNGGTDGYSLAATISEACTGAVYRVGMMSPTAELHTITGDGNTLVTDTSSGTVIDVTSSAGVGGLSNDAFDNAVKAAAARVLPSVTSPGSFTANASGNVSSFGYITCKPGTHHRWSCVAGSGNVTPVLYLNTAAPDGTNKRILREGLLHQDDGNFNVTHDDTQASASSRWNAEIHFGDANNTIKAGTHAYFDFNWLDSAKVDAQILEYNVKYTRVDGKRAVLQMRLFLHGYAAHPITGYALNSYTAGPWTECRYW